MRPEPMARRVFVPHRVIHLSLQKISIVPSKTSFHCAALKRVRFRTLLSEPVEIETSDLATAENRQ